MGSPVSGGVPPPVDSTLKPPANGVGNQQSLFDAAASALQFFGAVQGVGNNQQQQGSQEVAEKGNLDTISSYRDVHQTPPPANSEAVMSMMSDTAVIQKLGENVAIAIGVIFDPQKTAAKLSAEFPDPRPDVEIKQSIAAHTTSYNAAIDGAAKAPHGSILQVEMFSSAAIELAAILAEVSALKKDMAKEFARASIESIKSMIDGAHTQAQIELAIGQTNASAAFLQAGLQAMGAGISFMGSARGIQMAKQKIPSQNLDGTLNYQKFDANIHPSTTAQKDGFLLGADGKPMPVMIPNPTAQAMATNVGTMWQSVGQLFSQAGVSIVEGQKAATLGNLEALKAVLNNAMQILGQMMSKWGDAEKDAHDAQQALVQAMQESFKAFVASADKLAV